MGGLSSYPRSNGQNLPPRIAEAMRRHIPEPDQAAFSEQYLRDQPPPYLHPNSFDPHDQPGAIPHPGVFPHPPLSTLDELLADPLPVPEEQQHLLKELETTLRGIAREEQGKIITAFSTGARLAVLSAGVRLFRIIGVVIPKEKTDLERLHDGTWHLTNDPLGDWWTTESTLSTIRSEADLRAKLAMRTEWNGDHGIGFIELTMPIAVIIGPAASQRSTDEGKIFSGGGQQIYWHARRSPYRYAHLPIQRTNWSESS